jgi:UDP-glucose 4-epimerase
MKLLVTGGAGFIGSSLVDRLIAEGHAVEALDDLSTGSLANLAEARAERSRRFTFHQIDVRDPHVVDLIARRAPEVVFHLAARADAVASVGDPTLDAEVNVIGTVNVLEGARRGGTRKVVAASSGTALYGEVAAHELPVKESQAPAPTSPHGASRRAALEYLRLYRRLHALEYTALALASVYGPRQDPGRGSGVAAVFASHLLSGEPCTVYGDGEQTRDLLYIDDCVDAFVRAAERGDGLLINVGTGVATTVNGLYLAIAGALGVERPARPAAARPGEVQRSVLDPARAAIQLGWAPWTSLAEGVDRLIEWLGERPG